MKSIPENRLITKLYQTENQEDLGLKETEDFITETFEKHLVNDFEGNWSKKFDKVEISFITFGGDFEDNRGGDSVIGNVSRELIDKLKESQTLSKYKIEFKDISDNPRGGYSP